METPQNRRSNVLGAPASPLNEKAYNYPIRALEDIKPKVSFVTKLWGVMASLWNIEAALHILAVYLTFVVIPNVVPESFSEVPCRLPALPRHFPQCARELGHPRNLVVTPDFITLTRLQSKLEYVMEYSTCSSLVAVDMKDSEMALRDLAILVTHSTLSNKNILGRDLKLFVEAAEATSGSLQQFGNNVWGAVGRVVSENKHTITMLESISLENPGSSGGIASSHLPIRWAIAVAPRKRVEDLWLQAAQSLNKTLDELIHGARAHIVPLQMLEDGLNSIQDMTYREEGSLRSVEQAFKRRWFPDEKKLRSNSASYELLLDAQDHFKRALKHVKGMQSKLEGISRDLREAVMPTITAGSSNISIKIHIESILNVTERLEYGRTCMTRAEDDYRWGKFSSDQPARLESTSVERRCDSTITGISARCRRLVN